MAYKPFKMKGISPLRSEGKENLIEKLKRRQAETRIFSEKMKEKRASVSYGKNLHKEVLNSIANISDEKKKKLLAKAKEVIKKRNN